MEVRSFVNQENLEAASVEDGKRITLRVKSSGSAFCRNSPSTKEDHETMQKLT